MNTLLESVNISVLNIGYAKTQHFWGGTDLSSPFARLYYIKAGKATLHLSDKDLELQPGYMYLVPSYMPHSYFCDPGFEFYYLFVYERYGAEQDIFDVYKMPYEVKANQAVELLFTNYCTLYPQLSLPFSSDEEFNQHPTYRDYSNRYMQMHRYEKMQLQGLVWIISSYFMKQASKRLKDSDERVLKVCSYINQHIHEEIKIEQLENVACITRSQLGRLFRKTFGISPQRYLIRNKIQYAQRLLLTTDESVKKIASEIAIADVSYFIRLFKKHIGYTPQDYRESLKY